jgi:catechol 1,2-dioxygenase
MLRAVMTEKQLKLTRQEFLTGAAALVGAAFIPGCGGPDNADFESAALDDEPLAETSAAVHTPSCDETEDNTEGPFYRSGAPFRTVLASSWEGLPLVISGTVMGLDRQCVPLPRALLDVWQANDAGSYDRFGSRFRWRGRMRSGDDGRYRFETIVPGHYLNGDAYRPRHIHLKAFAPGHRELTTQIYFRGDPFLADDPFFHPQLVVPVYRTSVGYRATFNVVLAPDR